MAFSIFGASQVALLLLLLSCFSRDPIDGSPPGSSVTGILQARILEWVAIFFSKAGMHAKSLQLCLTLCDPMDSSTPGSSIHRSLQGRVLEWGAIAFSIDLAIIDSSYFMLYMTSVAGFFHLVKCFQGLSML